METRNISGRRPIPSLGTVFGGLAGDLQQLVRGEVKLARAELDTKLHSFILAAIWLLGGALIGFAGLVVLLEGLAALLAHVLPGWAALLIIGAVIVALGAILASAGLGMMSIKTLIPERTAANLQMDAQVVKDHT